MIHKISEFCDKIDSIKNMSDILRQMKYNPSVKSSRHDIDQMIASIQSDCYMVSQDKSEYTSKE